MNPLIAAVIADDLILVKKLLIEGADINSGHGASLGYASASGNLEMVKLLLDSGADIHINDDAAIYWSCYNNRPDAVKLLHSRGADFRASHCLLYQMCSGGFLEIMEFLLDNGIDINTSNGCLLAGACDGEQLKMVKLLLDRGADVCINNNRALCIACWHGNIELVKDLLSRGADGINMPHILTGTKMHILLMNHRAQKKYWKKWRRFMVGEWAARLLQIWYRPDVRGGMRCKEEMLLSL